MENGLAQEETYIQYWLKNTRAEKIPGAAATQRGVESVAADAAATNSTISDMNQGDKSEDQNEQQIGGNSYTG
jgi:hypothetical protein